jgi:glycosyltransferase involved in cell wall biosynthesis
MMRRTREARVLVLPYDRNPYQTLLYGAMSPAHDVKVTYWVRRPWIGLPWFFVLAALQRAAGAQIAHVHWPAWDVRLKRRGARQASLLTTLAALRWLRILGYELIWTVHNLVPHEPQTTDDRRVARTLCHRARAVIVHSASALPLMTKEGLDISKAAVIPHGNYIGRYPPALDRCAARARLQIPCDARVILFFGQVRRYKGLNALMEAWDCASGTGRDLVLLIAGECGDEMLGAQLREFAAGSSVVLHLQRVPDDDVASFFAASDIACLPFTSILTSGSALLALSFGLPLIAPRLGALTDLPEDAGFFYDGTAEGLQDAIGRAVRADPSDVRVREQAAASFAETLAWPRIATETYRVYRRILSMTSEAPGDLT